MKRPATPITERLVDPGTLMATTHPVGGAQRVRLRLTRPTDAAAVRSFLERLSPETRHRRFLHAMPRIPEATVRRFTFYDPRRRLVVVATSFEDGCEQIAGLADVAHLETGLAELAVVVDDDRQGRGVGKLLTEATAALAIQQGATHLKADLLEHNEAMLRLMERLGRTTRTYEDGVAAVITRLPARGRRAA